MTAVREWLRGGGGRAAAGALVVVATAAAWFSFRSAFGPSDAALAAGQRTFICAETGKPFKATLRAGMRIPVESPHSGKRTGYEAEQCWWTKEGGVRSEPVYVLLNQHRPEHRGKVAPPPTFCPDCGRLVRPLNPAPSAGSRPPPTEAELNRMKARGRPSGLER